MIDWIMEKINRCTGRRYWYEVKLVYLPDPNKADLKVSKRYQIGLERRNVILQTRDIKKQGGWFIAKIPKRLLKNGSLELEVCCYLGWLVKEKPSGQ